MALLKCKMCGGELEIADSATIATCEYCGTKQTLPKTTDSATQNLFNRANDLRIKCEFDRAEQTYEKILEADNSDAEAHWGLLLCRYGIEYVDDPGTGKKIPTCHRASFDPILTDSDYLAAVEMSDGEQKDLYVQEAKQISEIQKGILQIAQNEEPFDVFICYKETGEDGKRTVDSVIANDVYYQLTQEGYKVFYAPITLEDKLGSAYEPHIFAALNSARVMLAIGTKPAHFDAVWVKNEWSRFLALMKKDRTKLLIPCYKDMDPYDLPDRFAHLQAQDMGKIGFINDVVRGIKKVIPKDTPEVVQPAPAAPVYAAPEPKAKKEPEPLVIPEGHVAIYDSITMTLAQRIVMLVSVICSIVLTSQLSPGARVPRDTVTDTDFFIQLFWIYGLPAIALSLAIVCFVRKKKDIYFLILCVSMVLMVPILHGTEDISTMFRLSDTIPIAAYFIFFVVFAFLPALPTLAPKIKWLRFLFWLPPTILFVLILANGSPRDMYSLFAFFPFMFAVTLPMLRKTPIVISGEKLKKRKKNTLIAFVVSAVLAVAVLPSVVLEIRGSIENIRHYQDSIFTSTEGYNDLRYKTACYGGYSYTARISELEDLAEEGYPVDEDTLLYLKYDYVTIAEFIGEYVDRATKIKYLEDMAAVDFKDSKALLEEELKWHIIPDYVNTTPGDYSTDLGYVPRYSNYLYFNFNVTGGRPGETITLTHSIRWPGESHKFADWDWENVGDGWSINLYYENGYSAMTTGDMYIDFINKATGEIITTISIPVK